MALSCRDPTISEDHQVQLFTTGLGHQLRTFQKPTSLDEAVMYARAYAQRDTPHALLPPSAGRYTLHTYLRQPLAPAAPG
jgi:hypothetical protein